MRHTIALALVMASLSVAACGRENPLKVAGVEKVSYWIYQKKTPAIEACGKAWADRTTAKAEDLAACNVVAEQLAKLLTDGGFGAVIAEDVSLPELWIDFNERVKTGAANTYDKDEARKSFGEKW